MINWFRAIGIYGWFFSFLKYSKVSSKTNNASKKLDKSS